MAWGEWGMVMNNVVSLQLARERAWQPRRGSSDPQLDAMLTDRAAFAVMRTSAGDCRTIAIYETTPPCSGSYSTTSTLTLATPLPVMPNVSAADAETSTTRPRTNGPRSLTRTVTERPVSTSVTRSRVPNGNVRWAAVNSFLLNFSPLAVCGS